jgi:hypothetical protein
MNMKRGELFVGAVLMMALVAATIVAMKFGFGKIQHIFAGLDPQAGIILGVSAAVLFMCSALIAAAIRVAGRREARTWRHKERARLYRAFLDTLAIRADDLEGAASPLTSALFLLGSTRVLEEYRTLVHMLSGRDADDERLRKQVNRLMLAMRRDAGESTFGLENEDWLAWLKNGAPEKASQLTNDAAKPHPPDFAEAAHSRLSPCA